jgi:hypothetical protein
VFFQYVALPSPAQWLLKVVLLIALGLHLKPKVLGLLARGATAGKA